MNITRLKHDSTLTLSVEGRLDTLTAAQFEEELKQTLDGITELILDFQKLQYISSAGLRVLLAAQKTMNRQGAMRLVGVSEPVREVFDITGFSDFLTIQ